MKRNKKHIVNNKKEKRLFYLMNSIQYKKSSKNDIHSGQYIAHLNTYIKFNRIN